MLKELLEKLEGQHGLQPEQGTGIINTIVQHIKDAYPMIGGLLGSALGGGQTGSFGSGQTGSLGNNTTTQQTNTGSETTLQKLEDLAKGHLGGMFGG